MSMRVYDLYVKHLKAGNIDYLKALSRHHLGNDVMLNVENSRPDEMVFDTGNVRIFVCSDTNGLPIVYSLSTNEDDVENASFSKDVVSIVMNMTFC